jgi:hypothetical protein
MPSAKTHDAVYTLRPPQKQAERSQAAQQSFADISGPAAASGERKQSARVLSRLWLLKEDHAEIRAAFPRKVKLTIRTPSAALTRNLPKLDDAFHEICLWHANSQTSTQADISLEPIRRTRAPRTFSLKGPITGANLTLSKA